ncbi:hypothetical protein EH228_04360 [Erwinia endophytica]|uniref:hypothetical protein n=1 Tax=Erwinia endophytica TaxID=1563158 RepID=UPI001265F103|nr:hypothetical protein [Erwinia endophytica]KAB8312918.1 hypothetical protein EH228_04360 [Erwinia endophytica]
MPTFREYRQQRPTRGLYDTLTFYHSSFGYVRLVDKQFFSKTLGGEVYTPSRFEIDESQQSGTPIIDATVKLGRLATDVKTLLKKWTGAARLESITGTRQIFDTADISTPIKSWTLYVKTVDMNASDVSLTLSVTNPLNNNIGRLYDPVEYPGLQDL